LITGLAVMAALSLGLLLSRFVTGQPKVALRLASDPSGASVWIDGRLQPGTTPMEARATRGEHAIEWSLAGHAPVVRKISAAEPGWGEGRCCQPVRLAPAPARLRVAADLPGAEVWLDDAIRGVVAEGQGFLVTDLEPADHLVRVQAGTGSAEAVFRTGRGTIPELAPVSAVPGLTLCLVAGMGPRLIVHASHGHVRVSVDGGGHFRSVPSQGLELAGLSEGATEIVFELSGRQRRELLAIGPVPAVTLFAFSEQVTEPAGALEISSNEHDFTLLVNDVRATVEPLPGGRYLASRLRTGERRIRLVKDQYRVAPAAQTVKIEPGARESVVYRMIHDPVAWLRFRRVEPRSGIDVAVQQTEGRRRYDGPTRWMDPNAMRLPAGTYNLVFSAAGYQTSEATVYLKGKQLELTVDIGLRRQ
jgi:hypothetical protein